MAEKGYLRDCFQNAALAALWDDGLTYAEGFAHKGGMVVHHAWVVNQEGKAIEVTWRDGGRECGFCTDGKVELDEDDPERIEEDEETWWGTCRVCGGSGEADYTHHTLERAEYYGIPVDDDTLRARISANGIWGVLNTQQDLDAVLAARH
jgi:hypothetical protein